MKIAIDIPKHILSEVLKYTERNSEEEAILAALTDYLQRKRMADVSNMKGALKTVISLAELQELRGSVSPL
ncbi:MAG: hypothetical protein F9K24_17235 [Leptonema illini]|uniref:DUF2191 domain-containing protein n=1 Tax=Leptonema illini TaxID=183 RepID=A0A833GZ67_9LEPT|nr:MAG: hypothetical protein F9K24_17235 [Leptonema illini]